MSINIRTQSIFKFSNKNFRTFEFLSALKVKGAVNFANEENIRLRNAAVLWNEIISYALKEIYF